MLIKYDCHDSNEGKAYQRYESITIFSQVFV